MYLYNILNIIMLINSYYVFNLQLSYKFKLNN